MVDGVVHYCVANMPGAVPRTSTFALNNATLPYILSLAESRARRRGHRRSRLRQGRQHLRRPRSPAGRWRSRRGSRIASSASSVRAGVAPDVVFATPCAPGVLAPRTALGATARRETTASAELAPGDLEPQPTEVSRHRRFEGERRSGGGVGQSQLPGVAARVAGTIAAPTRRSARKGAPARLAVHRIADDGEAATLEVHADLVSATGAQVELEQRQSSAGGDGAIERERGAAARRSPSSACDPWDRGRWRRRSRRSVDRGARRRSRDRACPPHARRRRA